MTRRNATTHARIDALVARTEETALSEQRILAADAAFLDTFLALKGEARAARWRMLSWGDKFRLVARQIVRVHGRDWEQSEVEAYIAKYDTQYGDAPLTSEAAVMGALERQAETHQQSALHAPTAEERTYFRRWAGAYRKALLYYRQGARPETTPSGAWLIASATRAGQVHTVSRAGLCSCEAQDRGCWHAALTSGIEIGLDDLDTLSAAPGGPYAIYMPNPEPEPEPESEEGEEEPETSGPPMMLRGRVFGSRLAQARRAYAWA